MTTTMHTDTTNDRKQRHAAKHGLAAWMFDRRSFDAPTIDRRHEDWQNWLNPQNGPVEAFLVEHAVRMSFRLERCETAHKAMLVAAIEDLYASTSSESADPIVPKSAPLEQVKLLIRYEMHTEKTLKAWIDDLWLRTQQATARPQPIASPNEPTIEPEPARELARNEPTEAPKPARELARNEATDDAIDGDEPTIRAAQPLQTGTNLPVDPEYQERLRRICERLAPKRSRKNRR